jgi:hypothetical protein
MFLFRRHKPPNVAFRTVLAVTMSMTLSTLHKHYARAESESKPQWAANFKPPQRAGQKCFLGSSPATSDRNQALADAYKNALLNVIEREFPSLISISTRSSENLDGSSYSRDTAYMSENVQFSGLSEDKDSPFVDLDPNSQKFVAFRLLCWPETSLATEKKRQAELNVSKTKEVTNKIDGLLPPTAKPGPTGVLEITTVPSGATLLLAALPVGSSNARFERVIAGTYEIIAQKEGYEIETKKVAVKAGQKTSVSMALRRVKSQITISSEPPGAIVYVNNKPQTKKTPLTIEQVVGEEVDVRIEKDDFYNERRVLLVTNRPRDEVFKLRAQDAVLSVLSTPSGAEVYLDGRKIGKTPLIGHKVEGGKHEVLLKLDGYENSSETLYLFKSQPAAISPRLSPSSITNKSMTARSLKTNDKCAGSDCSTLYIDLRTKLSDLCYINEPEACTKLGYLYEKGVGGEQDYAKAAELYLFGCNGNVARACLHLGRMWKDGVGVRAHKPKAREYFEMAHELFINFCNAGDRDACFEIGQLIRLNQVGDTDPRKARFYYQRACRAGKAEACTFAGSR